MAEKSVEEIVQLLIQAHHLLQRTLVPLFREESLTFSDVVVLKILGGRGVTERVTGEAGAGMRLKDLGREVGLPPSTLTAVIDRLERLGYVERVPSPTDRRSVRVRPTEKWRAMAQRVRRRVDDELTAVLAGLPRERIELLSGELAGMVAVLRERLAARVEGR